MPLGCAPPVLARSHFPSVSPPILGFPDCMHIPHSGTWDGSEGCFSSSRCLPAPHPVSGLERSQSCTPPVYLCRWSDSPAAARGWVGWFKLWRRSAVTVLYLAAVGKLSIYGSSCLAERGTSLTVFFWKLAPGVCAATHWLSVCWWIETTWITQRSENTLRSICLPFLRRNPVTWEAEFQRCFKHL